MTNCLTCGGAILESNKNYSYGGQICYCSVPPKIQMPANKPNLLTYKEHQDNAYKELSDKLIKLQQSVWKLVSPEGRDICNYDAIDAREQLFIQLAEAYEDSLNV